MLHLPASVSEEEVLTHVYRLNDSADVDGVLIQLPVPAHINERRVCNAVMPQKDVDGFHVANIGRLCADQRALLPATPAAVLEIIKRTGLFSTSVLASLTSLDMVSTLSHVLKCL